MPLTSSRPTDTLLVHLLRCLLAPGRKSPDEIGRCVFEENPVDVTVPISIGAMLRRYV
jgi:hypothetical protein